MDATNDIEPAAWMWQHDETGRTGFVDCWQVENGWQAQNPRLRLIYPLYTKANLDAAVRKLEQDCERLRDEVWRAYCGRK